MIDKLTLEPGDLDDRLLSDLRTYDEQLSGAASTPIDAATATARQSSPAAFKPLAECLDVLERIWPRSPGMPAATRTPVTVGRFRIERILGHGGFGIVYLAHDPTLGRPVALKIPRLHALSSPSLIERFQREARAAAALDHPHIVPLYEAGEDEGLCYIASAYCPGTNLAEWLKEHPDGIVATMAAQVVASLADAVACSHARGILHRDIKPSNVFLAPVQQTDSAEGDSAASGVLPFSPRLGDFGLAKIRQDAATHEFAGDDSAGIALLGTPAYMAPEQLERQPDTVGPAVDIYALGVVLYELLAGRPPFQGTNVVEVLDQVRTSEPAPLRQVRPDVPRDLETICHKCLQRSPAERYATAGDLRDDLRRFLTGQPVLARRPGRSETVTRWIRRRRLPLAFAVVIATTMTATLIAVQSQRDRRELSGHEPAMPISPNGGAVFDGHPGPSIASSSAHPSETLALGLIAEPRELPGVRGWRMITRGPRSVVQHDWSLTWSPDSRFIAFGDGTEVRVYAAPSFELVRVLDGHTNSVVAVAWSPDGRQIASASADNTIRLWDATTGVPGPVLVGHRARVNAVAWRPDSQQLASGGRDNVVRIWNRDGSTVTVLKGLTAEIHCVAWSHSGAKLATGGEEERMRIWDVSSQPVKSTEIDTGFRTRSIDWSLDDARLLASHFYPTDLRVWSLDGTQQLSLKHDDAAVAGDWSPDGSQIASGSWDNTVRLWSADGTPGPVLTGHDGNVCSVQWSPDGKWVASGGNDHSVRLWHKDGQAGPVLRGSPYLVDADWSPDGRRFCVAGGDHAVRIADADGNSQFVMGRTSMPLFCLDWHPHDPKILTGSVNGEIRVWDVNTGTSNVLLNPMPTVRTEEVRAKWSPDGRQVAAAGRLDRDIQVLDANSGSASGLKGHEHKLYGVSWSPSGQQLASVSLDGTMRLWAADGTPGVVCSIGQSVTSVAWQPGGARLACGCDDGTIQFWHSDGRPGPLLKGHEDRAFSLAWSSDGRSIASGSRDNTVRLWSADGKALFALKGHAGTVHSVSWRPNSSELLSVGEDGIVRLWDVATGRPLWTLVMLADGQAVRISSDGRSVVGDAALIEQEFVCVVEQVDGSNRIMTVSEFKNRFPNDD